MKKTPGDIIILHKCTKNNDHMLYCSWNMVHDACNYCSFWVIFCTFTSLTAQKIKIKKKKKEKKPLRSHHLHKCIKNHDYMLYCYWDMTCDRCNCYFQFWTIFCPFTSLTAQKIKISQKWKKYLEISSFYTIVPKTLIICYTVPEIWHVTDVIVIFHFGLFFALLPQQPKPSKFLKNEKTSWRYHHFTHVYQKL